MPSSHLLHITRGEKTDYFERLAVVFPVSNHRGQRQWNDIFSALRENNCPSRNTASLKTPFKIGVDSPSGTADRNPPAHAGNMGSIPGSGKIPHRANKPVCPNYWAHALVCSATREARAVRSPCITTREEHLLTELEKAHMQQQRSSTAKNW